METVRDTDQVGRHLGGVPRCGGVDRNSPGADVAELCSRALAYRLRGSGRVLVENGPAAHISGNRFMAKFQPGITPRKYGGTINFKLDEAFGPEQAEVIRRAALKSRVSLRAFIIQAVLFALAHMDEDAKVGPGDE